jgi:hypothetical protein
LFYIEDKNIILEEGKYKINNTKIEFSEEEILALLENNPEMFSPNVIMSLISGSDFTQSILHRWRNRLLELKSFFNSVNITFPYFSSELRAIGY